MELIDKNNKRIMARFILLFSILLATPRISHATPAFDAIDWIFKSISNIFTGVVTRCDNVSVAGRFHTGSVSVNLDTENNQWKHAHSVNSGRMFKIQWNTNGIVAEPRRYYVLYRIDPRFERPQTFIFYYDYDINKYVSDFHVFNGGSNTSAGMLERHQSNESNIPARFSDYDNYINFRSGRSRIPVNDGDVINIVLKNQADLASDLRTSHHSNFFNLLSSNTSLVQLTTDTNIPDNKILYVNSQEWCNYVNPSRSFFDNNRNYCENNKIGGVYDPASSTVYPHNLMGIVNSRQALTSVSTSSTDCSDSVTGADHAPCFYANGRGMNISISGQEIKSTYDRFYQVSGSGNEVFYHQSRARGYLDFGTSIPMSNQYQNHSQYMKDWAQSRRGIERWLRSSSGQSDTLMNFIHAGSYVMSMKIGNARGPAGFHQLDNLRIYYTIQPMGTTPSSSVRGVLLTNQEFMDNAPRDGNLYIRVENPNSEVSGSMNVSYAVYGSHSGGVFFSDLLYDRIAEPIMYLTRNAAEISFGALANDPQWQLIVRLILTLYIIIFALSFLIGKVQITTMELVKRLVKIAIIFAVMQPYSWDFFYNNLFRMFLDGMSYLTYAVTGLTSRVGNIFGFVDVIFDKYFDWEVWRSILTNLLQIHNGMILVAVLMIEAIINYLFAVIDVVISYVLAFITICVLISFAPIVVVCMLFERTRGIFDNWASYFVNYMLQPTILLIFFLILDQLMTTQFNHVSMEVCWGWLIRFNIDIPIGDWFRIRFALPFFPGIPFYLPGIEDRINCPFDNDTGELMNVLGAVLMFKIYAQIGRGLIQYVSNITARLTNVAPARLRSDGGGQRDTQTPVTAISRSLGTPRRYVRDKLYAGGKDVAKSFKEGWKNPSKGGADYAKPSKDSGDDAKSGKGGGAADTLTNNDAAPKNKGD